MAFKYQIEMLAVGAADAFMFYCIDDETDEDCLVLIDCGHYNDGEKVYKHYQKYYVKRLGKTNIDIAIVTHCDEDHYGGFSNLLDKGVKIDAFYLNRPSDVLHEKRNIDNGVYKKGNKDLLELISPKKIHPCFANTHIPLVAGREFIALSPSRSQYKNLAKKIAESKEFSARESLESGLKKSLSPTLDNANDDGSASNASSIILSFDNGSGKRDSKYLFMGDAPEKAYNEIPDELKNYAKNVHWLKIPHHGSKHNIDSSIIKSINPKVAYISTDDLPLNAPIVNALSNIGCKIYSTEDGSSFLHKGFDGRTGYSSSTPMNQTKLDKLAKQQGD